MGYKLIYILNISILLASGFYISSYARKNKVFMSSMLIISIVLNFINLKQSPYLYMAATISSFMVIQSIYNFNIKKYKYRELKIGSLCLISLLIIFLNKNFLQFNIVMNAFISIGLFFIVLRRYSKKDRDKNSHLVIDLKILKNKIKGKNDNLKASKKETKKLLDILNNKKEILNIILEQNNKCVILIDKYGYISNEDSSFSNVWKEYSCCNYKIKFSHFLNKSIENSTDVLLDVQKVYDIGIKLNREIISKDNRYFDCEYTPLKVNNRIIGVICIMTDITYKKYSQKIINYNKIKYKKTIETIPHTIVVTRDNEITYNNNNNLEIDIYEDRLKDFILNTKSKGSFEGYLNKDTKKYLNINKASFEENNIKKDIAIIRDTTEYNVLLKSIEQSAKNYISLVNAIPQGIYIYDFEDKKTTYVNEVLLNMSGFDSLNEFNDSHIIKDISWVLNKFGQDVKFMRHKIQNRKGKYIDVELGGITLEINNKMTCIGIMNDITEKVKAENIEREIAKKKLEYKQKNHFFINMSHELKTPLNLIMSSNQLIQSVFKDDILSNESGLIATVTNSVKKQSYISLRLIENIMTLTKLEADFYKPEVDCYDVVSLVEDIIIEINKYSIDDKIKFIFDTNIEEKLVRVDPYDIERIILLLFSKLIKQSKQNSTIYIELLDNIKGLNIYIKNIGGYDKDICLNNQSRDNINMNVEVAKSIINIYGGAINIVENKNSIEIDINLDIKESLDYDEKKICTLNKESIYAEYSMINAL